MMFDVVEDKEAVLEQFKRATKPEPAQDKLSDGFVMSAGGKKTGLYHIELKDDGPPTKTWLSFPFKILGETRSKTGDSLGLLLAWKDADGNNHTWALPRLFLAGREFPFGGLVLADGGLWRANRMASGWRAFVFPDEIIKMLLPMP
ncbi:MAG: DUF927 domain-containing protein [Desulfovibrio sp.]|nr:DUF927 domain-containing protein [Desulfovibrio sp.]